MNEFRNFETMTPQEIHQIARGDIPDSELEKKIVDHFLNNQRFGESEIFDHIYIEAYEKENKNAIQRLAEWYQAGTYVKASDELYINELKHLFDISAKGGHLGDAVRIAKDLYDECYGGYLMAEMSQEDWICNSLLSEVSEELGVYYAGFSDIESLKHAEYYLRVALWCHADTKELLEETEARLVLLGKTNADMPQLKDNLNP